MKLIYMSPVRWHSFTQRPHEFVDYFHRRTKGKVCWVNPYPTRLPSLADALKVRASDKVDVAIPDWLNIITPPALPIEPLIAYEKWYTALWRSTVDNIAQHMDDTAVLCIGKPSTLALAALRLLDFNTTIYDAMDNFPAFYSGLSALSMRRNEQRVIGSVDHVLASSSMLYHRHLHQAKKISLVLNACAPERMPAAHARSNRADAPLVIGYVGTVGDWFDWSLVVKIATAAPHARLRIIGPIFSPYHGQLPPNIHIEQTLPHDRAMEMIREFDIGLIPFKRSPLTGGVDPIKYYEYRAMNTPVLSTRFGQMALRGLDDAVVHIDHDDDIGAAIAQIRALDISDAECVRFREQNSWYHRLDSAHLYDASPSRQN